MFGSKNKEAKTAEKKKNPAKIGVGKFWAWESRELSDAGFMFLTGYIVFYCTDVVHVNALLVGTLIALSKIIDGVTDVIFGYVVDRTNTKIGRGRPYDLCLIGAWISAVLLFSCPQGFSDNARIAWIVFWYVMSNAVFYTFLNAGEKIFMLRAFNHEQLIRMTSLGSIATSLLGLSCGILIPQLVAKSGKDPYAWSRMAIILAVVYTLIGLCRFLFVKEKLDGEEASLINEEKEEEKLELKEVFQMIRRNKYWSLYCLTVLISNIVTNMGVSVYYFDKVLGNLGIQSAFAAVSALAVIALVVLPALMKRFTIKQIMVGGLMISIVASSLSFIFYRTVPLLVVMYVINMAATVPGVYVVNLILYDNAIYNEYLGLHRMEGSMGSVNGFMRRVGGALGTFFLGLCLTLIGYDGEAATVASSTIFGLRFMMYGLPVVSAVLQIIIWKFYDLEERLPAIKQELEARKNAEAEA